MLILTLLGVGSSFAKRNFNSNALIEAWSTGPSAQPEPDDTLLVDFGGTGPLALHSLKITPVFAYLARVSPHSTRKSKSPAQRSVTGWVPVGLPSRPQPRPVRGHPWASVAYNSQPLVERDCTRMMGRCAPIHDADMTQARGRRNVTPCCS